MENKKDMELLLICENLHFLTFPGRIAKNP